MCIICKASYTVRMYVRIGTVSYVFESNCDVYDWRIDSGVRLCTSWGWNSRIILYPTQCLLACVQISTITESTRTKTVFLFDRRTINNFVFRCKQKRKYSINIVNANTRATSRGHGYKLKLNWQHPICAPLPLANSILTWTVKFYRFFYSFQFRMGSAQKTAFFFCLLMEISGGNIGEWKVPMVVNAKNWITEANIIIIMIYNATLFFQIIKKIVENKLRVI